ncbi:hypothetical protein M885DRAFT_505730 [Pelagophyceae sp. CCMP2097]|nr:hypothetical protein M885DRAFT_505730 [Pelagophyceae sp. CCMP2097]
MVVQLFLRLLVAALVVWSAVSAAPVLRVDVAIIGGGPCGLATALALRKASPFAKIAVFERNAELLPMGSSIVISKPGWAALKCIDPNACSQLKKRSAPIESLVIVPLAGEGAAAAPGFARNALKVFGAVNAVLRVFRLPRFGIVRSNLWHEVRSTLAARVVEVCGPESLRKDHALEAFSEAEGGGFALAFRGAGGLTPVHASIVLACDGARSDCRELAAREPAADAVLDDVGKSVWRGLTPTVDLRGRCTVLRDTVNSDGVLAITFPAGGGLGGGGGASWTVTGPAVSGRALNADDARHRLLASLPPRDASNAPLEALYCCVEEAPFVIENRLKVRNFGPGAPAFCSNTNGLAFLGDAAHPLRPTGEGVALAFEDAWQLADIVKASPGSAVCADALRCYEAARLPQVRQISELVKDRAEGYYTNSTKATFKKGRPLRPTPL